MFDDAIISINEISKLNASFGSSISAVGSQYKTGNANTPIAKTVMTTTNLNTSSYGVTSGSPSYMMGFNHGGGQFSVANIPFYNGGTTQTQFYVRPFTVNQTTGAITSGSGTTIWTNNSGNCNSTNTWGQAGPYIFNTGNHCAPGNGGNIPITTVARSSIYHNRSICWAICSILFYNWKGIVGACIWVILSANLIRKRWSIRWCWPCI